MKIPLEQSQALMKQVHSTEQGRSNSAAMARSVRDAEDRATLRRVRREARSVLRTKTRMRKHYLARKLEHKLMSKSVRAGFHEAEVDAKRVRVLLREVEALLRRALAGVAKQQREALLLEYARGVRDGHASALGVRPRIAF